jgi:hypothetical protein
MSFVNNQESIQTIASKKLLLRFSQIFNRCMNLFEFILQINANCIEMSCGVEKNCSRIESINSVNYNPWNKSEECLRIQISVSVIEISAKS